MVGALGNYALNTIAQWGESTTPMKPIKQTIDNRQLENNLTTNSQLTIDTSKQIDSLLDQYSNLITADYRKWYCKMFYKMPISKIHQLAHMANEGDDPQRLFTWLIKREVA